MVHARLRVAVVTRIPTPYRDPLFRRISDEGEFDLNVFYCSSSQPGRDWRPDWLYGFRYEILKGFQVAVPMGQISFPFKLNPGVGGRLKSGKYDVVVLGGYADPTMQLAARWCIRNRVPYALMSESHSLYRRGAVKRLIKEIFARPLIHSAAAYLPTGSAAANHLKYYGADLNRCFPFPNTPDVTDLIRENRRWRSHRSAIRQEMGIPVDGVVVLFVGRLAPEKGVRELIEAFAILRRTRPDVTLVLAGGGPLRHDLEERVKVARLGSIHFLGFVDPAMTSRLYAMADLFVLPSTFEPWGAVVNEAMACGLPVVTTRAVGAAVDLLHPGENGYVVDSGSVDQLSSAILKLTSRSGILCEMGSRSREIVREWGYERCMESFRRAVRTASQSELQGKLIAT